MRTALAIAIALMCAGPVVADEEVGADTEAAQRAGFEIVVPSDGNRGSSEFIIRLDRDAVAPWMRKHAPNHDYGFSLLNRDLDGDGFGDALVSLRTPAQLTSGPGGPALIIRRMGASWGTPELVEAVAFGLREREPGAGFELALINETGFKIWNE